MKTFFTQTDSLVCFSDTRDTHKQIIIKLMPSAHRGDYQGDGTGLWANDQHDEDVDQKHFRHFTMASESRTLERTIISVTRMP